MSDGLLGVIIVPGTNLILGEERKSWRFHLQTADCKCHTPKSFSVLHSVMMLLECVRALLDSDYADKHNFSREKNEKLGMLIKPETCGMLYSSWKNKTTTTTTT